MEHINLLGSQISHSLSPCIHNEIYKYLAMPWEYSLMDIKDPKKAEAFIKCSCYKACNVTTPYKQLAFECADIKTTTAQVCRGANLLIPTAEGIYADNLDGQGLLFFLKFKKVEVAKKSIVVCGTGPTSKSIACACFQEGGQVVMLSRSREKAKSTMNVLLKYGYNIPVFTYEESKELLQVADVIIDASPVGMNIEDDPVFNTKYINQKQCIVDAVYGKGETKLLKQARQKEARAYNGEGMLLGQAVLTIKRIAEVSRQSLDITNEEMFLRMQSAISDHKNATKRI